MISIWHDDYRRHHSTWYRAASKASACAAPSEIAGLVIAILGLALASLGVSYGLGIDNGGSIKPDYVIVSGIALATMCILNIWTKGYGKMFCVLIGIVVGYVASFAIGIWTSRPFLRAQMRNWFACRIWNISAGHSTPIYWRHSW